MNKGEIIKNISYINKDYDIKWLKIQSEEFLNKLLIDNMIISQGYGNSLYRYFK